MAASTVRAELNNINSYKWESLLDERPSVLNSFPALHEATSTLHANFDNELEANLAHVSGMNLQLVKDKCPVSTARVYGYGALMAAGAFELIARPQIAEDQQLEAAIEEPLLVEAWIKSLSRPLRSYKKGLGRVKKAAETISDRLSDPAEVIVVPGHLQDNYPNIYDMATHIGERSWVKFGSESHDLAWYGAIATFATVTSVIESATLRQKVKT